MYYSGSSDPIETILNKARTSGIWTTKCKESAKMYAKNGKVWECDLYYNNPLDLRSLGYITSRQVIQRFLEYKNIHLPSHYYVSFEYKAKEEEQDDWFVYSIIDGPNWTKDRKTAIDIILNAGYDSLILSDTHYGTQADSFVIFNEDQILMKN